MQEVKRQGKQNNVITWVDTDYAGCNRARRLTSGGSVTLGTHVIKTWSSTQTVVSLLVGEAKYYGRVKGSTMGIGIQVLLNGMGIGMRVLSQKKADNGRDARGRFHSTRAGT